MFQCSNVPMFQCYIVPMFQCSNVPMFQCSNVPMFQCSNVPMFQCSNVPMFQCSNVQIIKCSNFQMFEYQILNFCRSVPPEFLRSFFSSSLSYTSTPSSFSILSPFVLRKEVLPSFFPLLYYHILPQSSSPFLHSLPNSVANPIDFFLSLAKLETITLTISFLK